MAKFCSFAIPIYIVMGYIENSHEIKNGIILPFIIRAVSNWRAEAWFVTAPIKSDSMIIVNLIGKATFAEFLLLIFFFLKTEEIIKTIIFEVKWYCYGKQFNFISFGEIVGNSVLLISDLIFIFFVCYLYVICIC